MVGLKYLVKSMADAHDDPVQVMPLETSPRVEGSLCNNAVAWT